MGSPQMGVEPTLLLFSQYSPGRHNELMLGIMETISLARVLCLVVSTLLMWEGPDGFLLLQTQ